MNTGDYPWPAAMIIISFIVAMSLWLDAKESVHAVDACAKNGCTWAPITPGGRFACVCGGFIWERKKDAPPP